MVIGIATWQSVLNHGAVLQANATRQILQELGHTVEFVDFVPEKKGYTPPNRKLGDMVPWRVLPRRAFTKKKQRLFDAYREKNFLLRRVQNAQWDRVVIGSDEVFSVEGGFNPALFGVDYKCPVFSYAASCGPTKMDTMMNEPNIEQIIAGIQGMTKVGVRDKNTFDIVQTISGVTPTMTIDPVLLYGYCEEIGAIDDSLRKNIAIYSYTFHMDTKEEIRDILSLAQKHKDHVDSLGFFHAWCESSKNVGPDEILREMRSYRCLVTDTFHGTIMAIITHTPFCVIVRNNSPKILDLLEKFDLLGRVVTDTRKLEQIFAEKIDFESVDAKIEKERKISMKFLEEALEGKTDPAE